VGAISAASVIGVMGGVGSVASADCLTSDGRVLEDDGRVLANTNGATYTPCQQSAGPVPNNQVPPAAAQANQANQGSSVLPTTGGEFLDTLQVGAAIAAAGIAAVVVTRRRRQLAGA